MLVHVYIYKYVIKLLCGRGCVAIIEYIMYTLLSLIIINVWSYCDSIKVVSLNAMSIMISASGKYKSCVYIH